MLCSKSWPDPQHGHQAQKKPLGPCSEVGLSWAGARSQASCSWFPSAWEEDMLTTLTPPTSGWGEEGLVTGNLVLTLGKNSPGNPTRETPDPLFLCRDSWTGRQSGYFPGPRSLEAVRVATPRWPGSHPTSLFSLSPMPCGLSCSVLTCPRHSQEVGQHPGVQKLFSTAHSFLGSSSQSHSECHVRSPHFFFLSQQWLGQGGAAYGPLP